MSEYSVWVDRNRHTFLQYRDNGKTRHYVTMVSGSIETSQLNKSEFSQLKPYDKTPQYFAQKYLDSHLSVTRQARAVLQSVLGLENSPEPVAGTTSFSSGTVSLSQILEGTGINPTLARKHLRKLVDRPQGRWEWGPDEAIRVKSLILEMSK